MPDKQIYIKKSNGETELFSYEKLRNSLLSSGASEENIDSVLEHLQLELYDGMSSNIIYRKAFAFLKKQNRTTASRYSLKRAIFDLGPTGFPFERLIGALLTERGYKTEVSVILNGACVTHEIDVLAEKDGCVYAIECKFHQDPKVSSNVQVPLYINSRFLDIQAQWNKDPEKKSHLKQGWVVTNTKFTDDAINYARCVDLTLLSWDYPENNGLKANIDAYGLYPITTLTSLSKIEKHALIAKDIILVKELLNASDQMKSIGLSDAKIKKVTTEVNKLCQHNPAQN